MQPSNGARFLPDLALFRGKIEELITSTCLRFTKVESAVRLLSYFIGNHLETEICKDEQNSWLI